MTDQKFGELADVPIREAWSHEAHRFTPWLAENLDRLSTAIGIPLELTGTEMRCGPFSADIIARNALDDSVVLVENQLETSDHTHLGQIMTYLAGLQTHTMVWVAPAFREEHLSAIRWLNEHTVDPFSFFALRLRVVRIGDSPLAPLFEVIERPNNWDRQVAAAKKENTGELSEIGRFRLEFWTRFSELHPGVASPLATSAQWLDLPGTEAVLALYLASRGVGVYVRPARGQSEDELRAEFEPFAGQLEAELTTAAGDGKYMFGKQLGLDMSDHDNWYEACSWLRQTTDQYLSAFEKVMAGG